MQEKTSSPRSTRSASRTDNGAGCLSGRISVVPSASSLMTMIGMKNERSTSMPKASEAWMPSNTLTTM